MVLMKFLRNWKGLIVLTLRKIKYILEIIGLHFRERNVIMVRKSRLTKKGISFAVALSMLLGSFAGSEMNVRAAEIPQALETEESGEALEDQVELQEPENAETEKVEEVDKETEADNTVEDPKQDAERTVKSFRR